MCGPSRSGDASVPNHTRQAQNDMFDPDKNDFNPQCQTVQESNIKYLIQVLPLNLQNNERK